MTAQRERLPNRRLCERFKALDIVSTMNGPPTAPISVCGLKKDS